MYSTGASVGTDINIVDVEIDLERDLCRFRFKLR